MHQRSVQSLYRRLLIVALVVFARELSSGGGVQALVYSYSSTPGRNWFAAQQWCRQHFTDMVTINSQEETDFLNKLLPYDSKYYWIGLRNVSGNWTWVGSNKIQARGTGNWAKGEPNNKDAHQGCVEIYIKREEDAGKWNDERCRTRKGTLCYTASCSQHSCSAHADCVETIGNYTCQCHPGFQGPSCEAIACDPLLNPEQGSHRCINPNGPNLFNSSCHFQCKLGFRLVGAPTLQCQASGLWNHPAPLCQAEQCPAVSHAPTGGSMNCSHPIVPDGLNSTCEFRCDEGYELNGQERIRCERAGQWSAGIPSCTVKRCPPVPFPFSGNVTCADAVAPFSFGSLCNFTCWEGYYLTGHDTLTCLASGQWSKPSPTCTLVQCSTLKAPSNARVQCQDPVEQYSYGSICTVQCEEGFDLIGTNTTKCSSGGNWSHALPVCQAKNCSPILPPLHGSISCLSPRGNISFGSKCTSTCDEGFLLDGVADTACTSLGNWSAEVPRCSARPCPLLATAPAHGTMNCSHPHSPFGHRSRCDFVCNNGFLLKGAQTMTCNSSGHWNQDQPTCQEAEMSVGIAMLAYAGVGAATGVVLLSLLGVILWITKQSKKQEMVISDMSAWSARDNPAFES